MIYAFEGYDHNRAVDQAKRRSGHPLGGSATAATGGGNVGWMYLFVGLGLIAAGYVMTRDERREDR